MTDGIAEARRKHPPLKGELYRHFKGNRYVVLSVARDSGDVNNTSLNKVVYMNIETGQTYHRSVEEWLSEKVHDNGQTEERFMYVGQASIEVNKKGRGNISVTIEI